MPAPLRAFYIGSGTDSRKLNERTSQHKNGPDAHQHRPANLTEPMSQSQDKNTLSPTQIIAAVATDADRLRASPPPVAKGGGVETGPPDWAAMGEALRIRTDEEIPPPPVCLSVKHGEQTSTFGTMGNFSVLIGKAKSRKTFAISVALAAALKQDLVLNRFAGTFGEGKQTVLYFDTEQGRYHVLKVVKRICQLSGQTAPANLLAYPLRALSTSHRLGFIQWHIYNTPNVGLVVIDGIRDTVQDINDNAEATERVGSLLRWTEERGIHILTVIHMNKGNDQIRGTIGTELQNKAETVVSITVDPSNKDVSIVKAEYCRDKDFDPFAFSIDEHGLPFIVEDWQPDQRPTSRTRADANTPKPVKPSTVSRFTLEQHKAIARLMFADVDPAKYADTWQRLKRAAEYFGHTIGDNPAKELLTYYRDLKFVAQDEKKRYILTMPDNDPPTETDPAFADILSVEQTL